MELNWTWLGPTKRKEEVNFETHHYYICTQQGQVLKEDTLPVLWHPVNTASHTSFPTISEKIETLKNVFPLLPFLPSFHGYLVHLHTHSLKCSSFFFRLTYLLGLMTLLICLSLPETLLSFWIHFVSFIFIPFLFCFISTFVFIPYIVPAYFKLYKEWFSDATYNCVLLLTSCSKASIYLLLILNNNKWERIHSLIMKNK